MPADLAAAIIFFTRLECVVKPIMTGCTTVPTIIKQTIRAMRPCNCLLNHLTLAIAKVTWYGIDTMTTPAVLLKHLCVGHNNPIVGANIEKYLWNV